MSLHLVVAGLLATPKTERLGANLWGQGECGGVAALKLDVAAAVRTPQNGGDLTENATGIGVHDEPYFTLTMRPPEASASAYQRCGFG